MPKRTLVKADFLKRRALLLPEAARYDVLLKLPKGANLGAALVKAMDAIEEAFEPLKGQLPKDYDKFESDLLEDLLRVFDSETLRSASGDVFGRIYEYFLMKFAMQGAQDNGEFFTPPSLVQTIVNVIEPNHGIVFDPACGSGGMFVQSSHFIERLGQDTAHRVTFFGQEKTATTIRLAKMNLAVHGLEPAACCRSSSSRSPRFPIGWPRSLRPWTRPAPRRKRWPSSRRNKSSSPRMSSGLKRASPRRRRPGRARPIRALTSTSWWASSPRWPSPAGISSNSPTSSTSWGRG
jgi:hypothetical protein